MLAFLSFLVLLGIAYLVWRVTDQLPDLVFRLSEIQRDVAELRRRGGDDASNAPAEAAAPAAAPATPKSAASRETDSAEAGEASKTDEESQNG